jgi:SAM-dependent methyltransferase
MSQAQTELAKPNTGPIAAALNVMGRFHRDYIYKRRVNILAALLLARIPHGAKVLDVGCGDGLIADLIHHARPDIRISGIETFLRQDAFIPIDIFDGQRIPCADGSFDVAMLIDVLHHTEDPLTLLREAARVTRTTVLIKDHIADGPFARRLLRLMDWVGGARHGFALPYNYLNRNQWTNAIETVGLKTKSWQSALSLYPWPITWLFDSSLHFLAELEKPN